MVQPTDLRARIVGLQEELRRRLSHDTDVTAVEQDVTVILQELEVAMEELLETSAQVEASQAELTIQREQWRSLFEYAPDAYVTTDSEGMIIEANEKARFLLKLGQNTWPRSLVMVFEPASRLGYLRLLRLPPDVDEPRPEVVRLVSPPVDNFRAEIRLVHIGRDNFLWSIRDVTPIEEASQRLRAAVEQEREISRQLREFDDLRNALLLVVSHDLRAPLAAISGLATLLESTTIGEEQRLSIIERLKHASASTITLLNDLLDYQRITYGAMTLQREDVAVEELIRDAVEGIPLDDHELRVLVPPMKVRVDPGLTLRMIGNLVENAVQHTPSGATIWIKARREPDGVLIVVEDNGSGVPRDRWATIFDLFERGRTGGTGRLGVGLAVVARFAQLHGGYARVEDRPGGGATFLVLLPEGPDSGRETPPPGQSAQAVRSTARS